MEYFMILELWIMEVKLNIMVHLSAIFEKHTTKLFYNLEVSNFHLVCNYGTDKVSGTVAMDRKLTEGCSDC